jgi:hypothetical protein
VESESKPVEKTDEASKIESGSTAPSEKPGVARLDDSDAIALSPEEMNLIQERKKQATSVAGKHEAFFGTEGGTTPQQHHYRMLDSVLDQVPPSRRFKQPMLFDLFLAMGLLVAVAGFTTGLMRIYITHMAKQSINQHNYKAAITILKKNPVPDFFSGFVGSNPNELLNQALYLDAMTKLEANSEDQAALSQLSKITAGSRFFHLAQEILEEKTKPSKLKLDSGATHVASPDEINAPADNRAPLFEQEEN